MVGAGWEDVSCFAALILFPWQQIFFDFYGYSAASTAFVKLFKSDLQVGDHVVHSPHADSGLSSNVGDYYYAYGLELKTMPS